MAIQAEGTRVASRRRTATTKRHLGLSGYLWIVPAVLLVVGIIYYSIGYTAWISTLEWDGVSPERRSVGFQNYVDIVSDSVFWLTVKHMLIFSLTIFVQIVLGGLAAIVVRSRVRAAALYKTVLFLPVVIAPAVMAPVFRQMLSAGGELNRALETIGLGALANPWLADPSTSLYAVMAIQVWQWTGFCFVLYYAALGQLDPTLLDAARIDGAGNWRIIWTIIFPLMRTTTLTLIILGMIGVLRTFDIPYLVTGGGPARSSEFLSTYIYEQGITNYHAGYGAALTMVLMALALLVTVGPVRRYRREGI